MAKPSFKVRSHKTIEADVKKKFKQHLANFSPDTWYWMPVQTAYGKHGVPDFICCVPTEITQEMVGTTIGRFVGVETKRPGETATDRQADVHAEIRAAAGEVHVLDSLDVPDWLR